MNIHEQNNIHALYVVHIAYTQSPKSTAAKSPNYTSFLPKKKKQRTGCGNIMTKLAQNGTRRRATTPHITF
jgi:hypothetical protein